MNCQQLVMFLEVLPLRERTVSEMQEANDHTIRCAACAARMEAAASLERQLSHLPVVLVPRGLLRDIMDEVNKPSHVDKAPAAPHTRELLWWAAAGIALLATWGLCLGQVQPLARLRGLLMPPSVVNIGAIQQMMHYPGAVRLIMAASVSLLALLLAVISAPCRPPRRRSRADLES